MFYNNYDTRKASGLLKLAVDTGARRYALQTKRYDSNTGAEVAPREDTLTLEELQNHKAGLQEALRQVNKMITDLTAFQVANPLPVPKVTEL